MHFPLWMTILVMCVTVPFVMTAWLDGERRRAKNRTVAMLKEVDPSFVPERLSGDGSGSGPAHAASLRGGRAPGSGKSGSRGDAENVE